MHTADEKNELVRKILQVCATCSHGQGKGRGIVCDQYPGKCHSKKVKQWVKRIEEITDGRRRK